ncbi:hypothetical protein APHAL10511_006445 [Amanita phalloides]|nr:hypothetical protein APHAL10511_006445 [Amanita phalloides]
MTCCGIFKAFLKGFDNVGNEWANLALDEICNRDDDTILLELPVYWTEEHDKLIEDYVTFVVHKSNSPRTSRIRGEFIGISNQHIR